MKNLIFGAMTAAAVGTFAAGEARADHDHRNNRGNRGAFSLFIGNGGVNFGINRGIVPRQGFQSFGRNRSFPGFGCDRNRGFIPRGNFNRGHNHWGRNNSRRGGRARFDNHRGHNHGRNGGGRRGGRRR